MERNIKHPSYGRQAQFLGALTLETAIHFEINAPKTSNPYHWGSFTRLYYLYSEGSFFLTVPKRNLLHAQALFGFYQRIMVPNESTACREGDRS